MTADSQISLMTTPLAAYFGLLGLLHMKARPRLVSGPVDLAMLCGGLGGMVAFGPAGQTVVLRLLGGSSVVGWTTWLAILALIVAILIASATRRVVVYNIGPDDLKRLAQEAFTSLNGGVNSTIDGFEDDARRNGILLRSTPWLRTGTIEARGEKAEALMIALRPKLSSLIRRWKNSEPALSIPGIFYAIAALLLLIPILTRTVGIPLGLPGFH